MGELENVGERTVGDFGVAAPKANNSIHFDNRNEKTIGLINSEQMKALKKSTLSERAVKIAHANHLSKQIYSIKTSSFAVM